MTQTESLRIYRLLLDMGKPETEDEVELVDTNNMLKSMAENTGRDILYYSTAEGYTDIVHIEVAREGANRPEFASKAYASAGDSTAFIESLLNAVDTLIAAIGPADERIEQ